MFRFPYLPWDIMISRGAFHDHRIGWNIVKNQPRVVQFKVEVEYIVINNNILIFRTCFKVVFF
jgi:hypothetical protein